MACCCKEAVYQMVRGDSKEIFLVFKDDDTDEIVKYGSDNAVFTLTVKETAYREEASFQVKGERAEDEIVFKIKPEDTKDLDFGEYVFDIEMKDGDTVTTFVVGRFKIMQEVTL